MKFSAWMVLVFGMFVMGCQTAPTEVKEESQILVKEGQDIPADPANAKLNENIILLDARPAFAAAVAPIKQAQTLDWRDFTRRVAPNPTALEGDLFFHTRRLARMGISPDSKVMVLGRGAEGDGEEGRLAWTLRYLGVHKTTFANVDSFRPQMQNAESPRPAEQAVWKPVLNEDLYETRAEFRDRLKSNTKFYLVELTSRDQNLAWPDSQQFGSAQRLKFTQKDFLGMANNNDMGLKALFSSSDSVPVVVIDPQGEMAGYATAKLRDLGLNATCACGGFREYVIAPKDLK